MALSLHAQQERWHVWCQAMSASRQAIVARWGRGVKQGLDSMWYTIEVVVGLFMG
jgi:hypothetical protein